MQWRLDKWGFMVGMRKIVQALQVWRFFAHSLPITDCSICPERSVLLMYLKQQSRHMMMVVVVVMMMMMMMMMMMIEIVIMIPPISNSVA